MRFGFCAPVDQAGAVAEAGYDYFEPSVVGALRPEEAEEAVMPALTRTLAELPIRPEAFNVFLPGELRVTGPDVDPDKQTAYLQIALGRAALAGAKVVVFGSGRARMVPDGFPTDKANFQILSFLKRAAPIAEEHGITVVIEPLNRGECNIINSVAEGMNFVRTLRRPGIAMLSDLYHVTMEQQDYAETRDAGAALAHVHVAGREGRRVPTRDDLEFLTAYFAVLKEIGYARRISVEGNTVDIRAEAPVALAVMREAWDAA